MALLEFQDVSLKLSGKQIVQAVSFDVGQGEYVSLVGQNGAGKTTLLRCALGILKPDRGLLRLNGRLISDYSQRELARWVAYVPQDIEIPFPLSVFEFVLLGRFAHLGLTQTTGRVDREIAERALEISGALGFAERDFQSLSGGEKQRVLIAAALTQEPKLLLLDEVCHFLDPLHENEVYRLLLELNQKQGLALLSVTHDLNRAIFHSRQIVALKEGRVIFRGESAKFLDNAVLEKVYDKEFLFAKHPAKDLRVIIPDV